jgi:hypothetical protein
VDAIATASITGSVREKSPVISTTLAKEALQAPYVRSAGSVPIATTA